MDFLLSLEHVIHIGIPNVITIRTQILERFLSKVVTLLNISIHYQKEFVTFCSPRSEKEKWFALMKDKSVSFGTNSRHQKKNQKRKSF